MSDSLLERRVFNQTLALQDGSICRNATSRNRTTIMPLVHRQLYWFDLFARRDRVVWNSYPSTYPRPRTMCRCDNRPNHSRGDQATWSSQSNMRIHVMLSDNSVAQSVTAPHASRHVVCLRRLTYLPRCRYYVRARCDGRATLGRAHGMTRARRANRLHRYYRLYTTIIRPTHYDI